MLSKNSPTLRRLTTCRFSRGASRRSALLAVLLLAAFVGPVRAQSVDAGAAEPAPVETVTATPAPTTAPTVPSDQLGRGVPRGAMRLFLDACREGNFAAASTYLDLRRVNRLERQARGILLARQLSAVLDRKLWVDLDALSDAPEGDLADDLAKRVDQIGTIAMPNGSVPIRIERLVDDGAPVWKFTASTVAQIPALYDEFGYGVIGDRLPPVFFEVRFLGIQLWQWLGFAVLLVATYPLAGLVGAIAMRLLQPLARRTIPGLDESLLDLARRPLRLTLWALFVQTGIGALALAVPTTAALRTLAHLLVLVGMARLALVAIDLFAYAVLARRHATAPFIPLGRRTMKMLTAALALIAVLQSLGYNITSLLAGLGIGGLAVALAGQKTVEHLFGSVTLVADQPVRVGDVCRFGDKIGTVEDIGLRSTRLRTLDRTVISVPNGEFSSMQIENFSRRDSFRLLTVLNLRYETTPEQMRSVLRDLDGLLRGTAMVDPDTVRVRFVAFGPYSLDIELMAFVRTQDHGEFLAAREEIFLKIMDLIEASGTGFAFPSQTIYTASDTDAGAGKGRADRPRLPPTAG